MTFTLTIEPPHLTVTQPRPIRDSVQRRRIRQKPKRFHARDEIVVGQREEGECTSSKNDQMDSWLPPGKAVGDDGPCSQRPLQIPTIAMATTAAAVIHGLWKR